MEAGFFFAQATNSAMFLAGILSWMPTTSGPEGNTVTGVISLSRL